MVKISRATTSMMVLSLCLALPEAVHAQASGQAQDISSTGGLEDIVVTAQRRAENLQDVPIAVTAITAEALERKSVTDVKLLANSVPGLTYVTVAGLAAPRIRGIGSAIAGAGVENPVATYVDGVYYASAGAQVLTFNNIEQIAVLKGPQGTLFGRNATGGLIQITTADPSQTFSGKMDASYGNYDTIGANLYVTGGLTPGMAADLGVHYTNQRDGFGTNLFNGDDVNRSRNISLRSKIRADLGRDTVATLIVDYSKTRSNTPAYRPMDGTIPFDGRPFVGGKWDVNSNVTSVLNMKQYGGSLNLSHDFGGIKLVSITAYRRATFDEVNDSDAQPEDYINGHIIEPARQFSQELQLISSNDGPFNWQAGLYYFYYRDGFYPAVVGLGTAGLIVNVRTDQRTYAVAGYAQGTYKFSSSTSLTVGARLTTEKKKMDGSGSILTIATGEVIPQGPYSDSVRVTKPSWRIALDHKLGGDTLIYASYNRGFKSNGYDPASSAEAKSFDPEILDAYEIGLKTEILDRRVRVNTAAFYYDYRNIQLNSYQGGLTQIYNGKSATIYGLDTDLTVAATDNLTLTGGLSLLHARYGDFPISYTIPLPGGGNVSPDNTISAKGKQMQYTPDWQINLGAEYKIPLRTGSILLSADYFHSGRWYSSPDNRAFQDAYDVVNASATWSFGKDEDYFARIWGRNLANIAYAEQVVTQTPNADFINMAQARTYGVTLGAKF